MAEEQENMEKDTQEPELQKRRFPVKVVVAGVVLLLFFGGGFLAWKKGLVGQVLGGGANASSSVKKVKKEGPAEIGPIYSLETFIVNLNEPLGRRYLKARIELELDSDVVRPEIDRRLPQFRDAILTTLSGKGYNDVSDLSGKFQLRAEIISVLNSYLKTGKIGNVYFTEFVVQ